jgi:hypothetical protein
VYPLHQERQVHPLAYQPHQELQVLQPEHQLALLVRPQEPEEQEVHPLPLLFNSHLSKLKSRVLSR